MMMSKKLIITGIIGCKQCPYHKYDGALQCYHPENQNIALIYLNNIPEWCPLPDEEQ